MTDRRVVVTGIGLMSALGTTREAVWHGLVSGRCGIASVTQFDTTGYRSQLAAEIPAYTRDAAYSEKAWRRLSRSDQVAIIASREALDDAGLLEGDVDRARIGVLLGSGTANLMRNEEWFAEMRRVGVRRASPAKIFNHFPSTPSDTVAATFGLEGLKASVLSACSSGTVAVGYGADAIRWGQIDAALAGASDVLCRLTFSGFNALRLVDTEPCRPFCRTRKGMNLGESAAILVLEDLSHARRRAARIYAEIAGYGVRCEAYHPTAPEPEGHAVADLVHDALRAARMPPDAVDHVNAHGTATPQNDRAEARGMRLVFGERVRRIPVTSIKSMVGHCLAAAGAIEAAAVAMSIAHGVVPPTVNYREDDPECDVDVVANEARNVAVTCGVSTSLAFGGNNGALVIRRFDGKRA
ncbi:MAG: beta-ketoacyl-[acyl-carrier-protein] synthase II [Acidobacteria bacterium]|nr:MAG: beta-ketoacyl-[acyl-carrier-protein] synthase II [Acidobacteriota bacterium]PYQ80640.1 MAG: beta-ketoacyl-[acyl-carrier-protein] synthase II [Acidobacteriota bacterium]PYQ84473.1 MAG: beta-ketoacyl-[acyl-carrier-protein] synthase II [Acidobacteriota bacterium]PYR10954.1 MAG: beta-ketoacyl-[acyl-carrier-protein] synthase II [Acidobacteriota bacterium]